MQDLTTQSIILAEQIAKILREASNPYNCSRKLSLVHASFLQDASKNCDYTDQLTERVMDKC